MEKQIAIARMNADHLIKILYFAALPIEEQNALAMSIDFWRRHDCRRYLVNDRCMECGKSFSLRAKPARLVLSR